MANELQGELAQEEIAQLDAASLRNRLEADYAAAKALREHQETLVRLALPSDFPFSVIKEMAEARAKEMLAYRSLDLCGWAK